MSVKLSNFKKLEARLNYEFALKLLPCAAREFATFEELATLELEKGPVCCCVISGLREKLEEGAEVDGGGGKKTGA